MYVFLILGCIMLIGIGYFVGRTTEDKEIYKKGYTEAINDLYNKNTPKYILDKCPNGEVRWRENYEQKTYEELQEGD